MRLHSTKNIHKWRKYIIFFFACMLNSNITLLSSALNNKQKMQIILWWRIELTQITWLFTWISLFYFYCSRDKQYNASKFNLIMCWKYIFLFRFSKLNIKQMLKKKRRRRNKNSFEWIVIVHLWKSCLCHHFYIYLFYLTFALFVLLYFTFFFFVLT